MAKRKSKTKGLTDREIKQMQLKAAQQTLADVKRNYDKYVKAKQKRIAGLQKQIAELREELGIEC